MPGTLRVWPYSSHESSQTDINRTAHTVRHCRVRLLQYPETQKLHTGLKGQAFHARSTCVPSPNLLHQLKAPAKSHALDPCRGCGCGLYIPQLANSESSSPSSSPPPPSPPPQYSALPPVAGAPHHPWLAMDASAWGGTETAVGLQQSAVVLVMRNRGTGLSCRYCSIFHF